MRAGLIETELMQPFDEKIFNSLDPERRHEMLLSIYRNYNPASLKPVQWRIKRFIDITATLFGIVLISPLLLITALAIVIDSQGDILFRQKRIGRNGKEFVIYKFRSMKKEAEKELDALLDKNEAGRGMFKIFNDPRVTRVGKFIRKYSIDELPQLINVLKGEMSLVGPRPPLERELAAYKNRHYIRFSTMPGITGLWQVNGRSNIRDFDNVIKFDYDYVNNWSLLLDLKILLKTVPTVIMGKNSA